MSYTAIFVDGPLAGEVQLMYDRFPTWMVPLPQRQTVCICESTEDIISANGPEIFEYHLVAGGDKVLLYSKHRSDEEALIRSLSEWVFTDVSKTDRLINYCRDKRAFQ